MQKCMSKLYGIVRQGCKKVVIGLSLQCFLTPPEPPDTSVRAGLPGGELMQFLRRLKNSTFN